mmetsp:Transcript_17669/g.24340  ORF Transcript_17669/g.24340 Transcript_17669/m.24340 type:complete len:82 (-) Transcript_17669:51-296(-)
MSHIFDRLMMPHRIVSNVSGFSTHLPELQQVKAAELGGGGLPVLVAFSVYDESGVSLPLHGAMKKQQKMKVTKMEMKKRHD